MSGRICAFYRKLVSERKHWRFCKKCGQKLYDTKWVGGAPPGLLCLRCLKLYKYDRSER